MIEDGTPDILARITKTDRDNLDVLIPRAFDCFNALSKVPSDLMADWAGAVHQAIDPRGDFGLSKWSSQQVVEKILKA